ncbi:hypothetical protein [Pseudarthrobacter albicanus]|uniref:hypothetical protein n=1 Tax=Pseudarthrobacter albicanus TaxID=2823873 RepID=UPI001BAC3ECD|nr:hypothetical protein [Pseudarthrobacter albicanus]
MPGSPDCLQGPPHVLSCRRAPLWFKIVSAAVAVVFLAVLAFGGYWAWRLQSNITTSVRDERLTKA